MIIKARLFLLLTVVLALLPSKIAYAQMPGQISLSTCMDNFYGAGNWTYWTGPATGTDIEPALDACLVNIRNATLRGVVWIDPGESFALKTPIPPNDLSGNYLLGAGSQASKIIYQSSSGVALGWNGANGNTGGGIRGIGLLLDSGLGNTNSIGILSQGDASFQADQWELDDVYMSAIGASSHWYTGVEFYGNYRTAPQGIRVGSINNLQIFNCWNAAFYASNLVGWTINNLGTYTGSGGGNDVYITGGGAALTNSVLVSLTGLISNGTLQLSNASNINLSGSTQNLNVTDVANAHGFLSVGGTVSGSFGSNSHVFIN